MTRLEEDDTQLQQLIMQDPIIKAVYVLYQHEMITHDEMLIKMVVKLGESKETLLQTCLQRLEKCEVPII
jgi:DNA-directed RNA polymerase subunit L